MFEPTKRPQILDLDQDEAVHLEAALLVHCQTLEAYKPDLAGPGWSALSKVMGVADARKVVKRTRPPTLAEMIRDNAEGIARCEIELAKQRTAGGK